MKELRARYENFLFIFFGLNAKYRGKDPVQSTQFFAIAQATFFLGTLLGVLGSTALAFFSEWKVPSNPSFGVAWFASIYVSNLFLYQHWIGHAEMQRRISASSQEDLSAAERKAIVLLVVTVPAIMFSLIFIVWYVRG